jgi:hypothetical protein
MGEDEERLEQVAHVEGFELTPSIFRVIELGQRNVVVLTPPASLPNTRDTHLSLREDRVAARTISPLVLSGRQEE